MKEDLNLIVMLTHNDKTVENALDIFEICRDLPVECWGFKEAPLNTNEMKKCFSRMKECGKTTFLEVVEYDEASGLCGAAIAAECGADVLMGTKYYDSINDFCKTHNLGYLPFVGRVTERPSVLDGEIDEIIGEANRLVKKGVDGFDLLGYRYTFDANELNSRFIREVNAPTCVAGSVDSTDKLDLIKRERPWAFTVGSAFFENKFGSGFADQINFVLDYVD